MTAGPEMSEKIMIVDAGHGIGPALAALLADRVAEAGHGVAAWAPGGTSPPPAAACGVQWIHDAAVDDIDAGLVARTRAAVFNVSALDEAALLADGKLADAVAADGAFFLHTLQVLSRAMIERGRGQIWVLASDDSFAYYLPLPIAPVTHHTRIGAVRALAKEVSRFGVCANAAVLQPVQDAVDPAAWQAARTGLGSYAQRFKPISIGHVADTLAFWLARPALPLNGSVVHFGNGAHDGNV